MKPYIPIFLSLCLITLLSACETHYELTTEINPDGSCIRQCKVVTRDSAFLTGDTTVNPFPFTLDPSWQLSVYDSVQKTCLPWPLAQWTPTEKKSRQLVIATRYFPSVQALNDSFRFNHSPWQNIIPEITLKKSFRWFYTYYTFQEKFPQFPPEQIPVPLNLYLTPQEQQQWFQENPTAYQGMNGLEIYDQLNDLQGKADTWFNHNFFAMQYAGIAEVAAESTVNPFAARMSQARDSIFESAREKYDIGSTDAIYLLNQYFHTDYFSTLNRTKIDSLYTGKERIAEILDPQFNYELIMPGKVISSNAPYYEKNTLVWKVNAWRFLTSDYTITAKSRKVNLWTVILTLLFAGAFIYISVRRH